MARNRTTLYTDLRDQAYVRARWPAMRELDEAAIDEVTRSAVEALRSMPDTEGLRRAVCEFAILHRP